MLDEDSVRTASRCIETEVINPRPGNDFLAMYAGNWVVKSPPPETFFDISVEVQPILLLFNAFNAKI
jgi:hypothetical protein